MIPCTYVTANVADKILLSFPGHKFVNSLMKYSVCFSEILITACQIAQCNNPQYRNMNFNPRNLVPVNAPYDGGLTATASSYTAILSILPFYEITNSNPDI